MVSCAWTTLPLGSRVGMEAMREAVMLYASYVPSLTLGQMQYLLHNLLRRQAGPKWTELLCVRSSQRLRGRR